MKIIYIEDDGRVAVINPPLVKDVPAGKPYKIVEDHMIPSDREQRDAWTVDPALLTDGIGGESNEFPEAP